MAIGLSTYAFFWRMSSRVPDPMGLEAMPDHTAESGATVFQICGYPAVETLSSAELEKLRQRAEDLIHSTGTRNAWTGDSAFNALSGAGSGIGCLFYSHHV